MNIFFSQLFNLGTPFLIMTYPQICYYIGASIALIVCIILCTFPIEETRNIIISGNPPEYKTINTQSNKEEGEAEEVLEQINHC